ncbi:MAG: sugar phosphate nucleotidyltransferase [Kiritimatiellia bacterium]|jgi:NDP-sugar pyrophosphorylase family protein
MKTKRAPASFPRKAVILAAGFGTRMLPLSLDTPKPMMPLWGKPALGHILDMLARWGVEDVLINLHHQPEALCEYARRRTGLRPRAALSFEPDILGTGGALRQAAWFLDAKPFWMINADIAAELDPRPLIAAFHQRRVLAALWLNAEHGPRTVEMTAGRIANFASSRPGTEGAYTFCGLQLLSPRILEFIPPTGFATIVDAYRNAMAQAWKIAGACVAQSYWADIGTPDGYLQAHREILKASMAGKPGAGLLSPDALQTMQSWARRIRFDGFLSAGRNVVIRKGARIVDAVIWDNARVAADAIVEQAIIGNGCEVHGRVPRVAVRSAFSLAASGNTADIPLAMALQSLRWRPEETTVIPFEPRGSARHFTRLESHGKRVILVRYSREREENALYPRHARFLKSIGLPAPDIILDVPAKNFFVMQDLGDQSLQSRCQAWSDSQVRQPKAATIISPPWGEDQGEGLPSRSPRTPALSRGRGSNIEFPVRRITALYRIILASVARWHTEGARAARRRNLVLVAPFSPDLYRWEREFFMRNFLHPKLHPAPETARKILDELAAVAGELLKTPAVLAHRDLQSSNILLVGRRPFFIDFQGMRFGAAAYDLASLLCDPYVELPLATTIQLLDAYNRMVARKQRVSKNTFWLAAIERLAQALGAYGRLSANPETAWFGKYMAPGLRMMQRALEQSGACPQLLNLMRQSGKPMPDAG